MGWQWSLPECATSGTDWQGSFSIRRAIRLGFLLALLSALFSEACIASISSAAVIETDADVQAAIQSAAAGDVIIVKPGVYSPFTVDRPLEVRGSGATVKATTGQPGITVASPDVTLDGFAISGIPKDETSKFNYYMQKYIGQPGQPAQESYRPGMAPLRFDLPNTAVLVNADNVTLLNITVRGAEAGIYAEDRKDLTIRGSTMDGCERGIALTRCIRATMEGCYFTGCDKAGLNASESREISVRNCTAFNCTHVGVVFRNCLNSSATGNTFSHNTEGLALWLTDKSEVRYNSADNNYYGFLIAESHNNTVAGNAAKDNSRSEIVSGFGMGIGLTANSSYNLVVENQVAGSFNGIDLSEGCHHNIISANNISDNSHGIRVDKNSNNLLCMNNLIGNVISGYDNMTHNFWNASAGNYWSDYSGNDSNGDGIGDQPYTIPKGSTDARDLRPLVRPFTGEVDPADLWAELAKYARYVPGEELPVSIQSGVVVVSAKISRSPPKFRDEEPERPPFTPDI